MSSSNRVITKATFRYFTRSASTSTAWVSGFTFSYIVSIIPSLPIKNEVRIVPMYSRPINFFLPHTPYFSTTSLFSSDNNVKDKPYFAANLAWLLTGSTLIPNTVMPSSVKSGNAASILHAYLVQPPVSSLG